VINIIRKSAVIFVCLCMIISTFTVAAKETYGDKSEFDEAVFNLTSLEIIDLPGENIVSEGVTRGEFAKIASALVNCDKVSLPVQNKFSDANENHPYAPYISSVSAMGYMNGYPDGRFLPDDCITYEQCFKVLTDILGYRAIALQKGAYPDGYRIVASELKLTDNIQKPYAETASKKDVIMIIYSALEADMMKETGYGADIGYEIEKNKTPLSSRLDYLGLVKGEGVLNANAYTAADGGAKSDAFCVRIGDKEYQTGNTNAEGLIGCEVEFFASDKSGTPVLYAIRMANGSETVLNLNLSNIYIENGKLTEEKDATLNTYRISGDCRVFVNGIYKGNGTDEIFVPEIGSIKLIDIENNGSADVVNISEGIVLEVKQVNLMYEKIVFEDTLPDGLKYVDLKNDYDYKHEITDSKGTEIPLSDIKSGDYAIVYASDDNRICKIIRETEKVEGKVTAISDDSKVFIGEKEYRILKNNDTEEIKTGAEGVFFIVCNDIIVSFKEADHEEEGYACIENIKMLSGLDGGVALRLINGGCYEIVEEDTDDDGMLDIRTMHIANTSVEEKELSDYVRIDSERMAKEEAFAVLKSHLDKSTYALAVNYRFGNDGKITRIDFLKERGQFGKRTLNIPARLFGGNLGGAFLVDEHTEIISIPTETDGFSEEAYLTVNELENMTAYETIGLDIDEETHTAGAMIILTDSNTASGKINSKTKVSVAERRSSVLLEDGSESEKISGYTQGTRFEKFVKEDISHKARNISQGDLFYYSIDYSGKINDIIKLVNVRNLNNYFYNSETDSYYGKADFTYANYIGDESLDSQDVLYVNISNDESEEQIHKIYFSASVKPPIYLYDAKAETVRPATVEDIRTEEKDGKEDASEVYVRYDDSSVKVILIINR